MTSAIYAGLMSGTSMDGVDAVLVDFSSKQPALIAHHQLPYPQTLLRELQAASKGGALPAKQWLNLDRQVAQHFSNAIATLLSTANTAVEDIAAIGSHGQTMWHQPEGEHPSSWQIGDPNLIAATCGIPVVADFRRMDIAMGGQGAPLAPAFHAAIFGDTENTQVILNLGGIANITTLSPKQAVSGYDTGPANCLLDSHYRKTFDKPYDKNGDWAATGTINEALLQAMLGDAYFAAPTPKSTGPEHFSWGWVTHYLAQYDCHDADLQATLVELSCRSIANEIAKTDAGEVIACGGGVNNGYLMRQLQQALPANCPLETTQKYGIDPQHVEAMAFAWLAKQRLTEQPGNLPSVTGARHPCLLGGIYKA